MRADLEEWGQRMQASAGDRDFSRYNAAQEGRAVRPLAVRAVHVAADSAQTADTVEIARGHAGTAVELGCGIGIEARYLAEQGYEVWTYDTDPTVKPSLRDLASRYPVHHTTTSLELLDHLPESDLLLSCASLSFVPRTGFDDVWQAITSSARPGGILAIDLFGQNDTWDGTDGTFLSRSEVEELMQGWGCAVVEEKEFDGGSFSGPKHWHAFTVLARR